MKTAAARSRLLIVDDDIGTRETLATIFSGDGLDCELAADADAALALVERLPFDAVICDVRMDGLSGFELLDRVKRSQPSLPFILITGFGVIHDAVDAIKRGAFQYVTKPCDVDDLRKMVAGAVAERQPREQGTDSRRLAPPNAANVQFIGDGPAMRELQKAIRLVAASSAPVLITGETGVGKELVARAIHTESARRGLAFVSVNTSAIPQDLLEGEVFGHVRGAFTGAAQSRKGLLTEADGGTILLDEIGDMSVGLQTKLLRVLQFGDVRPVGSDRSHHVDVRVIAATHRDLPTLVREGRFREDLYFRLNVLPVFVPPLREHREDIPALAEHFFAEARRRTSNSPVTSIGPAALRLLTEAPWPGNVRELANAIERAVVFGTDEVLSPEHLSSVPSGGPQALSWPLRSTTPGTLRRLSQAYTEWVLTQTGGDKPRAAEILGIDLSTLYRWRRSSHN